MVTETFLIVCENVYEEFKVAVDLEGFDDTVVSSYPSTCGNPQLGWSALEKVLAESPDCKYIDIVGGCCISHLENRSDEGPPLTIHKLPHDLNLFADASLINSYIQKGVYMMTPGWLNRWQHWIDRWGFDQKLAREFFAEHNKKLVLLDTGIYSNSLQELQNISEFLNQPFEILPVGLQQLRLFLTKIVLNNRLKNEQHKSELNLAEAQKQISDYAMVVDLLMNLVRTTHEADTIRQIIDLFSMMFSAKELLYISFVNNQPQLVFDTFELSGRKDPAVVDRLQEFDPDQPWKLLNSGFALRIQRKDETLGVILADQLDFPEYTENYLKLAVSIVDVCGLALENARSYQKIIQTDAEIIKAHQLLTQKHTELEDSNAELTQIMEKLQLAKQEAEKANQLKSEFLANISHELRNPMHQILSFSKFGINKIDNPKEKLWHYFFQTRKAAERLMMLLNDLLDLSKMEAGRMDYRMESNNVFQIVNEVVSEYKPTIEGKSLSLKVIDPSISTKVICDYYKVGQVIRNLLSNAIKFTPEEKRIEITFSRNELENENSTIPSLQVSICDQGVGIPENELTLVFDKFTQSTKTKTGAGGTGLGLAICQEIIKVHGGRIRCENNPEGGATFSFMLPYE